MQDPASRPAAKELQQHDFVRRPHSSARTQALQPLIKRSRALAAAALEDLEGPPKLPPGVRCRPESHATSLNTLRVWTLNFFSL